MLIVIDNPVELDLRPQNPAFQRSPRHVFYTFAPRYRSQVEIVIRAG
jgi:hypothetical protein